MTAAGFAFAALADTDDFDEAVATFFVAADFLALGWVVESVRRLLVSDRAGIGSASQAARSKAMVPTAMNRGPNGIRPAGTAGMQQAVGEEAPFGIRSISPHCSSFTVRNACGCDRSQDFPRAEGPSGLGSAYC